MSSPLSNLRKTHKTPLPARGAPSPWPTYSSEFVESYVKDLQARTDELIHSDDGKLLDEVTTNIVRKKQAKMVDPFRNSTNLLIPDRKLNKSADYEASLSVKSPRNADAPSDKELMALMMSRISKLEQKLQSQNVDNIKKDKTIQILSEKLSIMENIRRIQEIPDSQKQVFDLETKCLLQQEQIREMEEFLADYGLKWVGESSDSGCGTYIDVSTVTQPDNGVWKPANAVVKDFKINHDRIVKNVRELNILAGEGQSKVQHTPDGARLQMQEAVPLSVYANGILLYNGPFRSISETSTQLFLQDLDDGYFPAELQERHPDGVPLALEDKRSVMFRDKREALFYGSGHMLGGDAVNAFKSHDLCVSFDDKCEETSVPGKKVSLERFLNKIPKNVIKNGKVVPVRDEISESLTGYRNGGRTEGEEPSSPASSDASPPTGVVTTLRIRTPTGRTSITIKLKPENTIRDLRHRIDKKRSKTSRPYNLVLPYPHKVLDNEGLTLTECGISNNCVLHMTDRK